MAAPLLLASMILVPLPAASRPSISLQAEAGAATFIAGPQTDRFGPGGGGSVRLEVPVLRILSVQVGVGATGFANGAAPTEVDGVEDPGAGTAHHAGGGLRLRPVPGLDRLWLDSDASYVRTGALSRFGLDGGLGYDVLVTRALRGAPFVRYTHVFQPAGGLDASDAQIAMLGVSVTWGRRTEALIAIWGETGSVEDDAEAEPDVDPLAQIEILDACPDDLEDPDGFEDEDGCPDDDNDGDGIVDASDECPLEPEVRNGIDDEDGCPDEGAVTVVDDTIVLAERIHFETNKWRIRGRSQPIMQAMASLLRARPDLTRVRVEGHADDRGSVRWNQTLSEKRAERVVRRLISLGVDPARLDFVGHGRSRPVQEGLSATARRANRRVEFRIVETADGTPPNRVIDADALGSIPAADEVESLPAEMAEHPPAGATTDAAESADPTEDPTEDEETP